MQSRLSAKEFLPVSQAQSRGGDGPSVQSVVKNLARGILAA